MKLVILILMLTFSTGALSAPMSAAENLFKDKTKIENPLKLRDPFRPPMTKSDDKKSGAGYTVTGKGQYSNIVEVNVEQLSVEKLKLVGVLIGKERRALASSGEGTSVVVLKEGMRIGPEKAELKAILPGGIILVERIINVYGEEEYLETVIPISK